MAAVTTPAHPLDDTHHVGLAAATTLSKDDTHPLLPTPQVHTPPTTDEGSHHDDDAASSSSLSDLGDDIDLDEENRIRFEDAARAGAEAEQFSEVKPDRYENGVPIFQPTMEQFKDFARYVKGVDPYGMQSGIVLIDPPEEWKRARKALDDAIKTIKIKNPITQEFHGAQGIYTQRNMEKMRSYNLPQWKAICESTENQPPAKRGEKRLNADKLLGRGSTRNKKSEPLPMPDGVRRKAGRPRVKPIKEEPTDTDSSLMAPPTPTSPEVKPVTSVENEENEDPEEDAATPTTKAKRGRKTAPKPKARQPKPSAKKEAGIKSSETTVAARRLRNVRVAADDIDEEAFQDFDYRVYDNDQWTAERCDELEEKYWKSLNFSNPMYAADMPGSLFDEDTKEWNVAKLPNLLDLLGQPIPGVNTAYLYLGMWRATFAWHLEDVDLYSINYIHFGAPKQWYSISQKDAPKFEAAMKSIWTQDAKNCDQFLRHKTYLVSPSLLKSKYGVNVNKVVHREGQFVITFPIGYHSGYNLGYNCAESVNFAIDNWLNYGKTARKCQCEADSVFIDVDWFIRKMNGEPTPEYEEIEVTDDEDDMDEPTDLPTPPGSERGSKIKVPQKRKRPAKDLGPNKKARKIVKIRKISKNQPCCLCPNDFSWEELLPTTHGQKAHRTCAMYTPETYIATQNGREMVFNIENISKARLELKCYECRQKKGSCFQCTSAKCTKSYHATCAMQAGVQVDKGPIAVWVDGVEYRDTGFDWRCRLHRTVKRTRITSELSASNHANSCWSNTEFKDFLANLQPGELIQWQATHADDIEAGVVMSEFVGDENSIMVKVLPEQKIVKEVEPSWILFVDSATSCLQKPTANAIDLPEELQGKSAALPESSERKPMEGDPFTENPKTEWAEFSSNTPPHNKNQKKVDLAKDKQLWLYLGQTSTESKAHFTADPTKPVHDPASVYLDTVEPPKTVMAPPPQPRRQSLAASFPMINVAARNAAMANMRHQMLGQQNRSPGTQIGPNHANFMNETRQKMLEMQKTGQGTKPSQYRDILAGAEARANEQARILQRQQAKAQQLDMQDRLYNSLPTPSIGIDQEAVERQRQFQQRAAQQSRNMDQQHAKQALPPLKQYHEPLPNYNAMEYPNGFTGHPNAGSSNFRNQSVQYSNDWMNPPAAIRRSSFSSQQNPSLPPMHTLSPQLGHTQSPLLSGNEFSPHVQPSHAQFPHQATSPAALQSTNSAAYNDNHRVQNEAARIESIRAAANQPAPGQPSAEVERRRRISNPAYPFKSPDQIQAQKEAHKNSPPGSRPTSSYMLPSPGMKNDVFQSVGQLQPLDPQNPPQFINPNVTQISPPGSSAGLRSASNSISGLPGTMGPPLQPQHKRATSNGMTMDLATFPAPSLPVSSYIPRRSIFDPANPVNASDHQQYMQQYMQQQLPSMNIPSPVAQPSRQLHDALQPRALARSGWPANDKPVPQQLTQWQEKGGFWGRVAHYYILKHQSASSAYRSPFQTIKAEVVTTDADRYYTQLGEEEKRKIEEYRTSAEGR